MDSSEQNNAKISKETLEMTVEQEVSVETVDCPAEEPEIPNKFVKNSQEKSTPMDHEMASVSSVPPIEPEIKQVIFDKVSQENLTSVDVDQEVASIVPLQEPVEPEVNQGTFAKNSQNFTSVDQVVASVIEPETNQATFAKNSQENTTPVDQLSSVVPPNEPAEPEVNQATFAKNSQNLTSVDQAVAPDPPIESVEPETNQRTFAKNSQETLTPVTPVDQEWASVVPKEPLETEVDQEVASISPQDPVEPAEPEVNQATFAKSSQETLTPVDQQMTSVAAQEPVEPEINPGTFAKSSQENLENAEGQKVAVTETNDCPPEPTEPEAQDQVTICDFAAGNSPPDSVFDRMWVDIAVGDSQPVEFFQKEMNSIGVGNSQPIGIGVQKETNNIGVGDSQPIEIHFTDVGVNTISATSTQSELDIVDSNEKISSSPIENDHSSFHPIYSSLGCAIDDKVAAKDKSSQISQSQYDEDDNNEDEEKMRRRLLLKSNYNSSAYPESEEASEYSQPLVIKRSRNLGEIQQVPDSKTKKEITLKDGEDQRACWDQKSIKSEHAVPTSAGHVDQDENIGKDDIQPSIKIKEPLKIRVGLSKRMRVRPLHRRDVNN